MEIDFLGLNSPNCDLEQHQKSKNSYADAGGGGVEISLSLSTASSSSSSSLNFSEVQLQLQRKKWEFAASSSSCSGSTTVQEQLPSTLLVVAPPVLRHSAAAAGFLYDLNDAAARNMNMPPLSTHEPPPSLTMLYPFPQPDKIDQIQNKFYVCGNASSGNEYTPTVAMARRASLARFLEKRLHRMNQARAISHLMGGGSEPKINKRLATSSGHNAYRNGMNSEV